jgi:hypothetical protein
MEKSCNGESIVNIQDHRSDWMTCPHCSNKAQPTIWLSNIKSMFPSRRDISLVVISECQKCFELSWIHRGKNFMRKYLKKKDVVNV